MVYDIGHRYDKTFSLKTTVKYKNTSEHSREREIISPEHQEEGMSLLWSWSFSPGLLSSLLALDSVPSSSGLSCVTCCCLYFILCRVGSHTIKLAGTVYQIKENRLNESIFMVLEVGETCGLSCDIELQKGIFAYLLVLELPWFKWQLDNLMLWKLELVFLVMNMSRKRSWSLREGILVTLCSILMASRLPDDSIHKAFIRVC